jgi:uncharacterized repeat protein (TIGR01451 family)
MVRIRTAGLALALGIALALVLPLSPSAAVERYDATVRGGLVVTGNTLGLSKAANVNGPGLQHGIATFIAAGSTGADLLPANPGNPWGPGTTASWQDNASAATLTIPAGATVTHAELVWGGSYKYGGEDVGASLDSPVELSFGAASPVAVAPDPSTALTVDQAGPPDVRYYSRSADVTAFVASHGPGTYTVGGVPATQAESVNTQNAAGWALAVAYSSPGAPLRHIAVDVSGEWVDEITSHDVTFADACAAGAGAVSLAAIEGDATLTGDRVRVGPDTGSLTAVSGPNNPVDNFFASQLNDVTGLLDDSGTFGTSNHDAATASNVSGGRQGMDVTTVGTPLSIEGADDVVVRLESTGDTLLPLLTGLAVPATAPLLSADGAAASPGTVRPGGSVVLTVPITNTGNVNAVDTTFALPLPPGVTATGLVVDGVSRPPAEVGAGTYVGTVPAGGTRTVSVTLAVGRTSATVVSPVVAYDYLDCSGADASGSAALTRTVQVDAIAPRTTITGKPKKRSTKARATFRFTASEAGSFQCSLDGKAYAPCASGRTYRVKVGKHTFRVRAVDAVGNLDASPASYTFTRLKKPRG